jgi:hypothetical protein
MIAEGGRRNTGIPETGFFTNNLVTKDTLFKNHFQLDFLFFYITISPLNNRLTNDNIISSFLLGGSYRLSVKT